MTALPAALGYRMPAEWEPHEATWIVWPHLRKDWPGKFACIPWVYAEIVRHLHYSEAVRILVNEPQTERKARRLLSRAGVDLGRLEFYPIPSNRVWIRDSGPLFITQTGGEVAITNWKFNAWAKYADWQLDDAIPGQIADQLGMCEWKPMAGSGEVVLEGGSIDVNGQGLLLTTEDRKSTRLNSSHRL